MVESDQNESEQDKMKRYEDFLENFSVEQISTLPRILGNPSDPVVLFKFNENAIVAAQAGGPHLDADGNVDPRTIAHLNQAILNPNGGIGVPERRFKDGDYKFRTWEDVRIAVIELRRRFHYLLVNQCVPNVFVIQAQRKGVFEILDMWF